MKAKILAIVAILALTSIEANAQCKGKCRNGFGTFTFESGETYTGNFVDGKFEGKGTYKQTARKCISCLVMLDKQFLMWSVCAPG
jgi:hypothetical protein